MVGPLTATRQVAPDGLPAAPAQAAHRALQAMGAPSDLLLFPGEGHPIVGRDHLVQLGRRVAAWFYRRL